MWIEPGVRPVEMFGDLIERTAEDLADRAFVVEWIGPGARVPVFDIAGLRDFAADADRRLFLAELLASYVRVSSGSVWARTGRGWRRRRYSELDPVWLADLIGSLPPPRRAGALRRLGDLALFLSGVFPDHAGRSPLAPRELARISRALSAAGEPVGAEPIAAHAFPEGGVTLLEWVGRHSYRAAEREGADVPREVVERFVDARRFLNLLTDRYLFPLRERWFGQRPVA